MALAKHTKSPCCKAEVVFAYYHMSCDERAHLHRWCVKCKKYYRRRWKSDGDRK